MIPVYQTTTGDAGNCFAACVASLLELRMADMPTGFRFYDEWFPWLQARGWGIKTREVAQHPLPEGYCIVQAASPRGFRSGHAVVAFNGAVCHDPYPNGEPVSEFWRWSILYPWSEAQGSEKPGETDGM